VSAVKRSTLLSFALVALVVGPVGFGVAIALLGPPLSLVIVVILSYLVAAWIISYKTLQLYGRRIDPKPYRTFRIIVTVGLISILMGAALILGVLSGDILIGLFTALFLAIGGGLAFGFRERL